jgi:hypothetical protein
MLDAGMMVSDTVLQTWLCPVQSNMQTNISLDSLFIETPVFQVGNEMEFQLEVTNYGEQALQAIPLKLVVNDKLVSVGNVDLEPHQTKSVQRKLTLQEAGYVQGYFEISDYPVTFDDKLFFTLNVLEQIPVLWITEGVPNPFLMKLLSQDKGFDLNIQEVRNLDYSLLNKVNFVILDELKTLSSGLQTELKTAINAGLAVLILPSEQSDITSVNNLTNETLNTVYSPIETAKLRVETILSEHSIFRSAFVKLPEAMLLPEVNKRFPIQISTRSTAQYLLRLNNDEPFLAFGNVGKGRIYLSSVPFNNDFSNFQNQPIFVVTVLNMLVQSVNNEHIYNILNQQEAVVSNVKNVPVSEIFYLKLQDSDFEVIPQVKFSGNQLFIDTYSTLKQAGNYSLQTPNDTVAELSYNFDRRESDLQSYSPSELNQILKDHGLEGFAILEDQFISSDNPILLAEEGVFWWKWCLLLALLFVLAEICVLRLL